MVNMDTLELRGITLKTDTLEGKEIIEDICINSPRLVKDLTLENTRLIDLINSSENNTFINFLLSKKRYPY